MYWGKKQAVTNCLQHKDFGNDRNNVFKSITQQLLKCPLKNDSQKTEFLNR